MRGDASLLHASLCPASSSVCMRAMTPRVRQRFTRCEKNEGACHSRSGSGNSTSGSARERGMARTPRAGRNRGFSVFSATIGGASLIRNAPGL